MAKYAKEPLDSEEAQGRHGKRLHEERKAWPAHSYFSYSNPGTRHRSKEAILNVPSGQASGWLLQLPSDYNPTGVHELGLSIQVNPQHNGR